MRRFIIVLSFLSICANLQAQRTIEKTLKKFNKESVPYVSVDEALQNKNVLFLDTRKRKEFNVSRLEGAMWVGYNKFSLDSILTKIPSKDTAIIVYCSIGVRSEDIGEKLLKAGYTDVRNLYGGLFEWKNKGNPVMDNEGLPTENVHAFSKHWGKLLTNAKKIY